MSGRGATARSIRSVQPPQAEGASGAGDTALPVRRIQSSYLQVADQLRDLILRGDVIVGQRLPSEAEMGSLFGVSRTTVREALRILVTDGLLVTRRGVKGGTFVAELDSQRIEGMLSTAFNVLALTNRVGAEDFLDAWLAIEGPAARLAARRRHEDAVAELDLSSRLLPRNASRATRLEQSGSFHSALLRASDNLLLEAMGRPVSAVARARFSQTAPSAAFWKVNTEEHRRIFEAVAAGDEDLAHQELVDHVEGLRRYYSP